MQCFGSQLFQSFCDWLLPEKEGLPLFLQSRRTSESTNNLNVLSQTRPFLLELYAKWIYINFVLCKENFWVITICALHKKHLFYKDTNLIKDTFHFYERCLYRPVFLKLFPFLHWKILTNPHSKTKIKNT
jgi:hypothetical protein